MPLTRFLQLVIVLAATLVAGCAGRLKPEPASPALSTAALEQTWQINKKRAAGLSRWGITGRAGVKTEQQSGVVSIRWHHEPQLFSIYMSGPFGRTLARLKGQGKQVILEVPGEQPVQSGSAEQLLYRATGWRLPFSSLQYWMRGIPAPGKDYKRVLNSQGYLAELHQHGWTVVYSGYREVAGVYLPERIKAQKNGVRVVLTITEWQLGRHINPDPG